MNYGTASFDEIREGMQVATAIGEQIRQIPNSAARNMVKELVALIYVTPKETPHD